jgi:outer membrane protein
MKTAGFGVALLFALLAAGAAEPPPLTLTAARETALRNHPRISRAELEALAANEQVTQARAGFLPTLTFNATAVDAGNDNTRIAAGALNNPAIYDREAEGLNATLLITDFGRTQHLLNSARLQSRAQAANIAATRDDVVLHVDIAFYAALKAQAVLAVARQTLDTRKMLLDQVTALARNKLKSDLDLSFASVTYEEGNLLVAKATTDLKTALATLANVLGERELRPFRLVEVALPAPAATDAEGMIKQALAQRPDLVQLRLAHEAAVQQAQAQKALNYPVINVFGSGGVIPFRDESHLNDRYIAGGVNLSLPLFDGSLNTAKHAEAEYRARAADERLRDTENMAAYDVRASSLNANYAFERLDLTRRLFENASQSFLLAQARYKVGSSSMIELSQAQLSKTTAEIANTSATYDYQIQRAILNFQIGATP